MYSMPTQEMLMQNAGQHFQLWISPDRALDVELIEVSEGIPMTPRHQCFSAHFALPVGHELPQAVFRVSHQNEEGWLLLMTPGLPCRDGRKVLHASFHSEKPD
ncbi:hypothetical protein [Salinicola sp. DM10]|uniref:DUF6916 family protein n=1 Tax=Salinicola sp. DM10 TaxID=2815721 RepID=UPI001A8ECB46|nr:hypothetical protein [Salinicola sp. DM10]MCE3025389.1 hypothetical protein [Salinicola sp. DM10]